MNFNHNSATNSLDYIRKSQGVRACKNMFRNMAKTRRQNAINLLNDTLLLFATLFILQPEIDNFELRDELNFRNKTALKFCDRILGKKGKSIYADIPLEDEKTHDVLLWMFKTGAYDDGLSDDFDQILDIVASLMTKTYHENSILPEAIDLIFERSRKGRYYHDIAWACFQIHDVEALRLIAKHLLSNNAKEMELARLLLHLPDNATLANPNERQSQYQAYLKWLQENDPYIYFTGESFQSSNDPTPCSVDIDAKYLCKNCSRKKPVQLTEEDRINLSNFDKLPEKEKAVLADVSNKIHSEDPSYWNQWMGLPLDRQLNIALSSGGYSNDCYCG